MDVSTLICPHYHVNGGREGEEGHVAAGEIAHMLPSGLVCASPQPLQPCLSTLNQRQHAPGPEFRGGEVPPPIQSLEKATGSGVVNKGGPCHDSPPLPSVPHSVAFCYGSTSQPCSRSQAGTLGAGVPARGGGECWGLGSGKQNTLKASPVCEELRL